MAQSSEYLEYLLELLRPLGGISHRAMFGGIAFYKDGIIFGMLINELVYLKVDDVNRTEFEARGLEPFSYEGKGKVVKMSYHRCPDEALESAVEMKQWALSGYAAALRAQKKKPAKKPVKKPAKN